MIVGCYVLDLYCEGYEELPSARREGRHEYKEFPQQYTGPNGRYCFREARKDGWKLTKDGKAFCPKCNTKGASPCKRLRN